MSAPEVEALAEAIILQRAVMYRAVLEDLVEGGLVVLLAMDLVLEEEAEDIGVAMEAGMGRAVRPEPKPRVMRPDKEVRAPMLFLRARLVVLEVLVADFLERRERRFLTGRDTSALVVVEVVPRSYRLHLLQRVRLQA